MQTVGMSNMWVTLKSIIWPYMVGHFWFGAPSCYFDLLDKLHKQICRIFGPSLAASHEPLAHHWNVASLSLFCTYYFGRCSSELIQLVSFPYSWGRSTCYSNRLHDFSVTIPRCYKDVYVNSFFPRTARLWNSLPIECFPLTYNINGFTSRINRQLLTNFRFLNIFPVCFNFFCVSFSCNSITWCLDCYWNKVGFLISKW